MSLSIKAEIRKCARIRTLSFAETYKLIREYILLLGSRIGVYFVGVIYRCIGINTKLGIIHTII